MSRQLSYLSITSLAVLLAALSLALIALVQPKTADAATYQAKRCGGGTVSLNYSEYKTFQYHNQARQNNGVRQLCVNPALTKAARAHSRDMIERDYFSHNTKGSNRTFGQRIKAAGYNYSVAGENLGYNTTPKAMHNAWMNSSGHRKNILNGRYKEVGIGAVTGNYRGDNTTMYTVDFGSR